MTGSSAEDMMMVITVTLQDREDGGLRVSSSELPGLILSGSDKAQVVATIIPAIEALLRRRGLAGFTVHHAKSPAEILKKNNPQDIHVNVQRYVVEMAIAA